MVVRTPTSKAWTWKARLYPRDYVSGRRNNGLSSSIDVRSIVAGVENLWTKLDEKRDGIIANVYISLVNLHNIQKFISPSGTDNFTLGLA